MFLMLLLLSGGSVLKFVFRTKEDLDEAISSVRDQHIVLDFLISANSVFYFVSQYLNWPLTKHVI